MSDFIEWYKNRFDCVMSDVDVPLMDWIFIAMSIPVLVVGIIALCVTCPIWGIPYAIYKSKHER